MTTTSSAFDKMPFLHHFRSMRGLKQYNLTSMSSTMAKTLDRTESESTYVSFEEDDASLGNKFEPYKGNPNRRAIQRRATQRTAAIFEKVVARPTKIQILFKFVIAYWLSTCILVRNSGEIPANSLIGRKFGAPNPIF